MKRISLFSLITVLAACGPETQEELSVTDFDALRTAASSSDPSEGAIKIRHTRFGAIIALRDDLASELWDILEQSGHRVYTYGDFRYVFGRSQACVATESDAYCRIFSRRASQSPEFLLKIHGHARYSAAGDLFRSIAKVVDEKHAQRVQHGRFVCERQRRAAWCGIEALQTRTLELEFAGLEALGEDFVYEGWLITSEGPLSTGRFSTELTEQSVEIPLEVAEDSSAFVLTIEPALGDDPAPADTHLLAGAFQDQAADLNTAHPAAIGTDFLAATGSYILETPSTSSVADDYALGVWFVDPVRGAPSLNLPELPSGWAYEGWVVDGNGPVSTGTFLTPAGADSDQGGPTAGPDMTPPFPGQDFIRPPQNLVGRAVVISVEPVPDNSPAPFTIKPLVDGLVEDLGAGTPARPGQQPGHPPVRKRKLALSLHQNRAPTAVR